MGAVARSPVGLDVPCSFAESDALLEIGLALHNFQDYYCTDCGFRHRCADGHSYKDGRCTWCGAPDPAVIVPAIVSVDKSIYTTGEPVCFTISPSGTTYTMYISRCITSSNIEVPDEPWDRQYKDVGASFALSFDRPGRYQVSVVPNSNSNTICGSSSIIFAIVDPCTSSSGHTFESVAKIFQ